MTIRILAIDDEPTTLHMLRLTLQLKRPDWVFLGAEDGQRALELVAQQAIDVVLLDISMPGMDGFEVCRRLRALPQTATVPIVMFTALDTDDRRERALAAGATAFWVKPFLPAEFLPEIERLAVSNQRTGD